MKQNRKCKNCNEIIPYNIIIDNKRKSLQRRKFCLKCSPYNGHNTRTDLSKCSLKDSKKKYSEQSKEFKENYQKYLYEKGQNRKKKLVDLLGGKCEKCGYNKCLRCLSFHHKDPKIKNFCLNVAELRMRSYERCVDEAMKCQLLCNNCHGEIHEEIEQIKKDFEIILNIHTNPQ